MSSLSALQTMWIILMRPILQIVRHFLGGLLAMGLIMFGYFDDAKRKAFSENKITGLFFHTIDKDFFEKCIIWLKNENYVFISTDQLIDILNGHSLPPRGAVWITFDDGWKENMEHVVPVALKHKIPITFFISTDPVENGGAFWWTYAFKYKNHLPDHYRKNIRRLWHVEERQRRQVIDNLVSQITCDVSREAMTIEDVQTISEFEEITVGSHTVHHVINVNCTTEELDAEIGNSKRVLEQWMNKRVTTFSYPNGDYNRHEKQILQKHGIQLAATTENRFVTPADDLYYVPRFWVRGEGCFAEALCQMVGIWNPLIRKIEKLLHFNFAEIIY
jgi:poly-beta-1,6-N-acetyl-D-glucosamine N-deacetylase